MNNPEQIEEARATIKQLCDILNISSIVSIDNQNATGIQLEDIVVAACKVESATLQAIFPELGDSIPEDTDVLSNKIREVWEGLDEKIQVDHAEKILAIARLKDGSVTNDPGDAAVLRDLIPDRLVTLSLKQWNEQRDDLLKETATSRKLFLFDQNFTEEGGSDKEGMKIIISLLKGSDAKSLICCLLTHTVSLENQYKQWDDLSKENNLSRDQFIVISKQYLSKDPIFFAQMLKLVALTSDCSLLKEKAKIIITKANDAANEEVNKITVYDLEHIVFRVAAEEGLWEPDMLFRLYNMFHRLEARQLVHADSDLLKIINRMRSVSEIPTSVNPCPSVWELQKKELYESVDHLNKNYLPLDLGDIFKKTETKSKKFYILLAQPCDLMVRLGGERHPELEYLPLIEISPLDMTKEAKDRDVCLKEELKCFGEKQCDCWIIKFKFTHYVKACILDLCVLNSDGISKIQLNTPPPDAIRPAWKDRYAVLVKKLNNSLKQIDVLLPKTNDSVDLKNFKQELSQKNIVDKFFSDSLFKGKINETNESLSFNCQRVGRLTRGRAFGLLMAYTSCLSRPAYDVDFVK